jgi:hypothetical protein
MLGASILRALWENDGYGHSDPESKSWGASLTSGQILEMVAQGQGAIIRGSAHDFEPGAGALDGHPVFAGGVMEIFFTGNRSEIGLIGKHGDRLPTLLRRGFGGQVKIFYGDREFREGEFQLVFEAALHEKGVGSTGTMVPLTAGD